MFVIGDESRWLTVHRQGITGEIERVRDRETVEEKRRRDHRGKKISFISQTNRLNCIGSGFILLVAIKTRSHNET